MMAATTYTTRKGSAVVGSPRAAQNTAPVPMVPTRNFFLLPETSARLPSTGMSSASTRLATVSAMPQATVTDEPGSVKDEKYTGIKAVESMTKAELPTS